MTPTSTTALEILKQDRLGRVRTPRAQQEAILAEFDRSGMSGQQFAQYLGIKYQTFATWVQKRRKRETGKLVKVGKPALRWVEAEVGGPDKGTSLIVELGGGSVLRVGNEGEAKLAAVLLNHLGAGRC